MAVSVESGNGKLSVEITDSSEKFIENLGYIGENISLPNTNSGLLNDIAAFGRGIADLTTGAWTNTKVSYDFYVEGTVDG